MKLKILVLLLVLISLSGCTEQIQLGKPEIRDVSFTFGEVSNSFTEIKTIIEVYNPNPVPIPLKDILTEIYMNGIKMGEGSAETAEIKANGISKIIISTKIDNNKIPEWWISHLRNGEFTELLIKADLVFDLKLFEFKVPIEKREDVETHILSKLSLSSPQTINFGFLKLTLESVEPRWGKITNETSEIILNIRVKNENPIDIPLSKLECYMTMNNLRIAEGRSNEPVIMTSNSETDLDLSIFINNTLLDDWWASHIKGGEKTEIEMTLKLFFEYGGKEYEFSVKGLETEFTTRFLG
jgi:LEA14-like dessication related protein